MPAGGGGTHCTSKNDDGWIVTVAGSTPAARYRKIVTGLAGTGGACIGPGAGPAAGTLTSA